MTRKIVLDCDPGHDDAVAMLLAHGNPTIEVLAVTTVGGNQTLAKVTDNARAIARLAGITAPVAAGCARPFVRPLMVGDSIHGESGLGGVELPPGTVDLDPRHGVDVIIDEVMSRPAGEVTLVPIGPLTNIAMAARKEPRIVERVAEVVLMGGGVHGGNRTPVAEFNIACDPESAHVVFEAGWPVTMVPLDLTHQARADADVMARLADIGGPAAQFVVETLGFYGTAYRETRGLEAPPVHDPCAVAYVIDPSIMTTRRAPVTVELTGSITAGMTVVDLRRSADPGCVTRIAEYLDVDRFWDLVVDAVRRISVGRGVAGD